MTPAALLDRFRAFPCENATKLVAGRRRTPEEMLREHRTDGAGGTCFDLVNLFHRPAREAGLDARYALADRSYGRDTHCAVIVGDELCDPGYMQFQPIPLRDAPVEVDTPFNRLRVAPRGDGWDVSTIEGPRTVFRYHLKAARVSEDEFVGAWERSFEFEMMNHLVAIVARGDRLMGRRAEDLPARRHQGGPRAHVREGPRPLLRLAVPGLQKRGVRRHAPSHPRALQGAAPQFVALPGRFGYARSHMHATCPTCSERVAPGADGICPSCRNPLPASTSAARILDGAMPSELAGYRIGGAIAHGAYGAVYSAVSPDGRTVALKVLSVDGVQSGEAVARFQREAQAAMNLSHPNIVRVYDAGFAGRRHFIAMELVEGTSLRELMDSRDLPLRRAVEIVRDVARALQHAHDRGVIHRDLKPENVLVTREGIPKISDFGIAKLQRIVTSRLTATGIALGTPEYMSPEQAAGRSHDADQRSDIYTLGVILYEAASGRLPFVGRSVVDTLRRIEDEEPAPPSRHSDRADESIEAIILRAMAKRPAMRYETAENLAADLDRWLRGEKPMPAARHDNVITRFFGRKKSK